MRFVFAIALFLIPFAAQAADPCADFSGSVHRLKGNDNTKNSFRDVGIYDATGQLFTFDSNVTQYPIDVRANSWCWKGGAVHRTNSEKEMWTDAKHPNNTGIYAVGRALIDGVRFHNTHDAIRPARDSSKFWTVRDVWVSYNRDDCIENDWFASGLVDNSLFDGCYVFLSSRNTTSGHAPATVTIQNSLIRLQDMPGPYGHPDPKVMGHGALFKYQSDSPKLVLKNNVFLMEEYASTKSTLHNKRASASLLGFQGSKLKGCSGNIIVWTGPGDFPGNIPSDQSCVRVTKDRTVWDKARDQWLVNHPNITRISGVDDPVVVGSGTGSTTTQSGTTSPISTTSNTTTQYSTTSNTTNQDSTSSSSTSLSNWFNTTSQTSTSGATTTQEPTSSSTVSLSNWFNTTGQTSTSGTTTTQEPTTSGSTGLTANKDGWLNTTSTQDATSGTASTSSPSTNTGSDTQPPTVTVLSPGKLVERKSDQVIEVAADDNVGVLRVEISINGQPYAVLDNTSSVNWTVPDSQYGSYDISATAIDLSGNYSTTSIHVFAW
jgi:hypothetical protein